jgi:hypothetical protein
LLNHTKSFLFLRNSSSISFSSHQNPWHVCPEEWYTTPVLGERHHTLLLELLHSFLQYQLMICTQFVEGNIQDSLNVRHLDQLECPTRRAKNCVDVKSTPHAKHTSSRISWLHTRGPGVESGSVPVNFP